MAIQQRRGLYKDFDKSKMLPAEYAVTLGKDATADDTNYERVYATFSNGSVKRMMTVEDAANQLTEATETATKQADADATLAKSYAVGGTSSRTGENTDNAKYYKEQAATSATSASTNAVTATKKASEATTSATAAAASQTAAKTSETNAATSATNAKTSETNASTSATTATNKASAAATSASAASTSASNSATSATNAANSASAAATSATNAKTSETNAASSATAATNKAAAAASSAVAAMNSETAAAASAQAAQDATASVTNTYYYVGNCATADLPTTGQKVGMTYNLTDAGTYGPAGTNVAWNGTEWDALAGIVDLSPYMKTADAIEIAAAAGHLQLEIETEIARATKAELERFYNMQEATTEFKTDGSIVTTNSDGVLTVTKATSGSTKVITEILVKAGNAGTYTKTTTITPATETTTKKIREEYTLV